MTTDLDTAKQVCTAGELAAWILADRGLSQRNIAATLDISRSTVRSRLENAARKISHAKRKDAA